MLPGSAISPLGHGAAGRHGPAAHGAVWLWKPAPHSSGRAGRPAGAALDAELAGGAAVGPNPRGHAPLAGHEPLPRRTTRSARSWPRREEDRRRTDEQDWAAQAKRAQKRGPMHDGASNLPATFVFFVPGMALALLRIHLQKRRLDFSNRWWGSGQLWFAVGLAVWVPVLLVSYKLDFLICVASFLAIAACVLLLRDGPLLELLDWEATGRRRGRLLQPLPRAPARARDDRGRVPLDRSQPRNLGLIGVPVSIAVALLSYRAIEAPFLRLRRRWSRSSAAQDADPEPVALQASAPAR